MATNADEFGRILRKAGGQIPFALSLAINRTAEDIQRAQVQRFYDIFEVRTPSFFGRPETAHRSAVKRTKKATKRDPVAELAILPPGGKARSDIIARHEQDRSRKPRGGGTLAIPIEARRGKRQKVPKRFRPKALDLKPHGSGGRVFRGEQRTFLVRGLRGGDIIFRRTSRRRKTRRKRGRAPGNDNPFAGTQVLYRLKPETPLTPRLEFFATAGRVFEKRLGARFVEAYEQALRTAR